MPKDPITIGDNEVAPSVETREAVFNATADAVQKHKRRGRPPGSRKAVEPIKTPSAEQIEQNLHLVRKTVESVLGAVDGMVCRTVAAKAKRVGCDDALTEEIWKSAGLTKPEAEIVCESTTSIVTRYDLLMRYAPEAMLACVMASYGLRIVMVMKRLDFLERKFKAEKLPRTAITNEPMAQKP